MITRLTWILSLRLLGFAWLWRGVEALPLSGAQFCRSAPRGEAAAMLLAVAEGLAPLLLAVWLIQGSPLLVRGFRPWRSAGRA